MDDVPPLDRDPAQALAPPVSPPTRDPALRATPSPESTLAPPPRPVEYPATMELPAPPAAGRLDVTLDAATLTMPPAGPSDLATATHSPDLPGSGPTSARRMPLPSIPGYDLLGVLGRGGMGVVYKARQVKANRLVALKMILSAAHATDADRERFRVEAESVARLDHPNVVKVFDVGDHDGLPYFALELCPGGSLADQLKENPLPAGDAAATVERVSRGVQAAHEAGIVHRDLKPANVLLAADGTPKVTDFGLAKRLDDDAGLTRTGAVMGTPSFMAPEQAAGDNRAVGPAADVYALGAILYDCLTGRPPFKGLGVVDTLQMVRTKEPISPRLLNPSVPTDLETICLKCLRKEPTQRYLRAADLADDLERFRTGRPIRARPVGRVESAVKFARRHPLPVGLAAIAFLLLTVGLTVSTVLYLRAEEERVRADGETLAARDAEAKERVAKIKAVAASNKAREVLDAMTSDTAGSVLTTKALSYGVERDFLAGVMSYYQEFAGETAADEVSRARTADAAKRVAHIQFRLGRYAEAATAEEKAIALYQALRIDFLDRGEYQLSQAASESALGVILERLNQPAAAEKQYRSALAAREHVLAAVGTDKQFRGDSAATHLNLAALLKNRREFGEAEGHLRTALQLLADLVAENPTLDTLVGHQATAHANLSSLLDESNRLPAAAEQARLALALRQKLYAKLPNDPEVIADLASSHFNAGNRFRVRRDLAAASKEYETAVGLQERLVANFPTVGSYRKGLISSQMNLAGVLDERNKPVEATQLMRSATLQTKRLASEFPGVPAYAVLLGGSSCNLGNDLARAGKPADALPYYDEAVTALTPVAQSVDDGKTRREARMFLRNSYDGRARALDVLKRYAESAQDWQRALELSSPAEQRDCRAGRATALLNSGRHADAVKEFDEIIKLPGWAPSRWYQFAECYLYAARKLPDDSSTCRDRAMECLTKAVAAGFTDVSALKREKALDPLRDRDEFKALLAQLEKKAGKK